MISFNKTIIMSIILYMLFVLISLFAGSINEQVGYVLFLCSSVFFSAEIAYEIWRESKPIKEIKCPIEKAAQKKKELSDAVQKALSEKSPPTYVVDRLRQILRKRLSLRLDVPEDEVEKLLQNPKNQDLGYDKLACLISEDNFLTKTRNERMKLLNTILSQLEEN